MILLTLAAGRGTRVQSKEFTPKPLIEVRDRPLIYWSIDSFHSLRATGQISDSEIFVVALEKDSKQFSFREQLDSVLGTSVGLIELPDLTSGPAETAYKAILRMGEEIEIDLSDILIINDCDHHFNGSRLLPAIEKLETLGEESVLLCTTQKNPLDLSWSFLQESNGKVLGLVEKPKTHLDESINFSEGLVGTYVFRSVGQFLRLYSDYILSSNQGESFISKVLDHSIKNGRVTNVEKVQLENFSSLGTLQLIKAAAKFGSLGGAFKESGSIFLDLDGTIFKHEDGGGLGKAKFKSNADLLDSRIPEWVRSLDLAGYSIIIVSARPESARAEIINNLVAHEIPFDGLVLGVSGGPRFTFNDIKDSLPAFFTTYSINYPRNDFPIDIASSLISKVSRTSICNEYIGESGERTFLLNCDGKLFIRKLSQNNANSRELIAYQAKWLQTVGEVIPEHVPKVLDFEHRVGNSISFFDCEYIVDSGAYGSRLALLRDGEQSNSIQKLVQVLEKLYTSFYVKNSDSMEPILNILERKALIGIERGFLQLGLSRNLPINARVNGQSLSGAYNLITEVLNPSNSIIKKMLRGEKHKKTLIHGDPTLSNILMTPNGNFFFLDPIGSRVWPDFDFAKEGLGRTHPIFDFSRIRLSLEFEYERWSNEISIEMQDGERNYQFARNSSSLQLMNYLRGYWPREFSCDEDGVEELVFLTTLARIFPYKARSKKKEAFYLLGLLQNKCIEYKNKYLQT